MTIPAAVPAAVVLAAGGSRRFGDGPKQLARWRGETLVHRTARRALEAGCGPVIVVVGDHGAEVAEAVTDLPVRVRENGRWAEGQSTSVRAGLAGVPPEAPGVLFLPCDQPLLTEAVLRRLLAAATEGEPDAVVPVIDGGRRAPVYFGRRAFAALETLTGDTGGRRVLGELEDVREVPFDDPDPFRDVDTPEAFEALPGRDTLTGEEDPS